MPPSLNSVERNRRAP
jgi:mRNA interferase RelE/StbE